MTEEDELLKELEDLDLKLEDKLGNYGSPEPQQKDSNLKFFRELIHSKDSRKFGNLDDKKELGNTTLTIRDLLQLSKYCEAEGLEEVSEFFNLWAEDVLATSLSKKGFLAQLFVTQIKKESKLKDKKLVKRGLFSKPEEVEE